MLQILRTRKILRTGKTITVAIRTSISNRKGLPQNLPFMHHGGLTNIWPFKLDTVRIWQASNASSFGAGALWSGASQAGYSASSSVILGLTAMVLGFILPSDFLSDMAAPACKSPFGT